MTTHSFYQVDVFTRTPLGGNPLAVFPDARELDGPTMQAIAREMNLSETTFVAPSERAARRIRFFTPTAEIPLAGHPTIGTWWLLAELGELDLSEDRVHRLLQETDAGVLPVDVEVENGEPVEVTMLQSLPDFLTTATETERLAQALGGGPGTVREQPAPQVVSTALPQLMVPISDLATLQSLPSGGTGGQLAALLREVGSDCAMCYTMETEEPDSTVHCRMFAPGFGIPEDPATGSAAGALGSYLVWHGALRPHDGTARIVVEQGKEIGRPSRINVEIAVGNGGEITEVRVGGQAVTVVSGELRL